MFGKHKQKQGRGIRGLKGILAAMATMLSFAQPVGAEDLERMVEKEISKWDPWITEYVESDYTNTGREGHVSLRRYLAEWIENAKKAGLLPFRAAYSPKEDFLFLPTNDPKTIGAISHELSHALYDTEGILGLLHQSGFNGPSIDEIKDYTTKKTSGSEFNKLKEELRTAQDIQQTLGLSKNIQMIAGGCFQKLKQYTDDIESMAQEYRDLKDYILESEQTSIKELGLKIKEHEQSFNNFRQNFSKLYNELANSDRELDCKDPELKQKITKLDNVLKQMAEELKNLQPYLETVKKTRDVMHDSIYKGRERYHDHEISEIDKQIAEIRSSPNYTEEEKQRLIAEYEKSKDILKSLRNPELDEALKELSAWNETVSDFSQLLNDAMNQFARESNIYEIDQILGNPDEVLARMISSLYNLHYGDVNESVFPLTDEDLTFLERFEYNGKKIFRKAVEKYRLGLEMIADGCKPEEVKALLEYSERFSYEGKDYIWPGSGFTIKGSIPEWEIPSKSE